MMRTAEQIQRSATRSSAEEKVESTRYRVLHISDIHFGAKFDTSVWEYVLGLIRREGPNLVACTGDIVDHGGLFMLAVAREEFERVRQETGVNFELRCVRGNHDCGPWGNVKIPPFSWNYDVVFGPNAMTIPRWLNVPSYSNYRFRSLFNRLLMRAGLTFALYCLASYWKFRLWTTHESSGEARLVREDDPEDVVLVYLDSNHQMLLASGNVDVRQVTRLKALLLNIRDENGARSFSPRIALIHHHPLPIPDAKITEGLTSFEPFLVLRNAGILLRELNRCDIDLVLHGHKHYSSFSRLGYSLDHRDEGEIAVLAAGSAGVTHEEQGRNSINFVDVYKSGRIGYTTIQFGAGGGRPVTELFRSTRFVHGMEMHKARMHRRAAERQGQWAERIRHRVEVDPGGDAVTIHNVESHHFERDLQRSTVPLRIHVCMGRVSPNTLKLSEDSRRAGHLIKGRPAGPEKQIDCCIELGQQLSAPCPPQSYGYKYVSFNTYAVTAWEAERAEVRRDDRSVEPSGAEISPPAGVATTTSPTVGAEVNGGGSAKLKRIRRTAEPESDGSTVGFEFTSLIVRVPVVEITIELGLPETALSPEPQVRVMRWSNYPNVPLDGARQFQESNDGHWIYDSDASQHEAGQLLKENEHWTLRVNHPLVGHRYDIRWRVRDVVDVDPSVALWRRACAMAYRRALLEADDVHRQNMQSFLQEFLNELCKPLLPPLMPGAVDDVVVALFAYDDRDEKLKLILGEPFREAYADYAVPLNEGVVGAAFKRAAPVCYVHPELSGSHDDSAYLYDGTLDPEEMGHWRYLIALPIFASVEPFRIDDDSVTHGWLPSATVGVMTLASESPASGLARIALRTAVRSSGTKSAGQSIEPAPDYNEIWAYAHVLLAILEEQTGAPRPPSPRPKSSSSSTEQREGHGEVEPVSCREYLNDGTNGKPASKRGSAVEMKRTTGGLLQGSQRALTREDLRAAVQFLRSTLKTKEQARKALRLDHFDGRSLESSDDSSAESSQGRRSGTEDVQDLQRQPKHRSSP